MTRRAVIALAVWAAVMVAGIVVAAVHDWHQPAVGTTPPRAEPCRWHDELMGTLGELGADPAAWSIVPEAGHHDHAAITYLDTGQVEIRSDVPCRLVGDVVRHEWMHLQQARAYPGWGAVERWGDRMEYVADCGSWLLGSVSYTPYRDEQREQGVGLGCTPRDLADARALIEAAQR